MNDELFQTFWKELEKKEGLQRSPSNRNAKKAFDACAKIKDAEIEELKEQLNNSKNFHCNQLSEANEIIENLLSQHCGVDNHNKWKLTYISANDDAVEYLEKYKKE